MILLEEVVAPGCHICKEFEKFWETIKGDFPNVEFKKIDVTAPEGMAIAQKYMIFASPGIIINNELFSTGGFDKEKIVKKLKELS
ncbi:MAG: thioredoxin family protein [Parcubacteria group bacterium]|nr:thioredoxin family protein [Parcubacteria group bacterium]